MSPEEIKLLKKRLDLYDVRVNMLRFHALAIRHNSRLRFLLCRRNELHVNDCAWSKINAREGPDTCDCYVAEVNPEGFIQSHVRDCTNSWYAPISYYHSKDEPRAQMIHKPWPRDEDDDEDVHDFYHARMLDFDKLGKWIDLYECKRDALKFRLLVREWHKEGELDAVFNASSREWHLTDCRRCVDEDEKPDTCHCRTAMEDPPKYVTDKYGYVDMKKEIEKILERRNKSPPPNYYKPENKK